MEVVKIPIDYSHAEKITSQYANNVVIQHTDHEFVISFFEILPPVILGEIDDVRRGLEELEKLYAKCVSKIVVPIDVMPEIVKAFQINLDKYQSKKDETE